LLELGKVLGHRGQRDEAESAYREGVEVWQELAEEFHGRQTYRNRLAEVLRRLGYLLSNTGRCTEALTCFERALELTPNNLASHSRLAFFRLHAPDESLRDAAKALTHAARAVELKPLARHYQLLAEAAHRTGDWQRMAQALEKTLELGPPADSPTCFQLAIAHGHLGDREKATKWLAKGVASMERQEPDDTANGALRAQAERVLGLNAIHTTEN
jgi:tetratricopeptide (TPR) repeat protein